MCTPVTSGIFDTRDDWWDRTKGRRDASDLPKFETGQSDLSNHRVELKERVGIMGEVLS